MQQIIRNPAPGVTVVTDQQVAGGSSGIDALRVQRRELTGELERLRSERTRLNQELRRMPDGADRRSLDVRLDEVAHRIDAVDDMLSATNAQLEEAGVREQVIVVPGGGGSGSGRAGNEKPFYLGGLFMVTVLLPLSIAFAIRLLRRAPQQSAGLSNDVAERLSRMERAIEASAIEIERIGEGQRYLTRVLTAGKEQGKVGQPFS